MAHTRNLSTEKVEAGKSEVQDHYEKQKPQGKKRLTESKKHLPFITQDDQTHAD